MDDFVIRNRGMFVFRYLIGVLFLILASTWGVMFIENSKLISLLLVILFTGSSLILIAGIYRPERAVISKIDGGLSIRWTGQIRKRRIYDILIKTIKLQEGEILILFHSGKSLKLFIKSFSSRQKEKIYSFFINYSSANGINIFSDF